MKEKTINLAEMERKSKINSINKNDLIKKYGTVFALIALVTVIGIMRPEFISVNNIFSIVRQSSINGFMAFGMTMVILTGGIDLSVGSTLALSSVVCAGMITSGVPVPIAMMISVLLGLGLGFTSGLLITKGKLQPFIATLVTMTVYRGLTFIFTNGKPISDLTKVEYSGAEILKYFGRGDFLGIPFPVILFFITYILFYIYLNNTTGGRKIYAIGSNDKCAKLAGISITKTKLFVYSISGAMAAISGLILASRLNSAQPTLGTGYELDAIAAVALGGTSMNGGRGRISGTLIGVLIIAVLSNGLNILDVSSYYQDVVKGLVILIAVLLDRINNKK